MAGYVKLHRSLMHPGSTFSMLSPVQRIIAIYLILNANHKDGYWTDQRTGNRVEIKRGQLIVSTRSIQKWFPNDRDVTHQKIRTCLDRLEKDGFLTREATRSYTLITLHNYGVYQGCDADDNTPDNTELTQSQHSPNTQLNNKQEGIKNDKKVKKVKEKTQYAEFVRLQPSEYEKLAADHGEAAAKEMIAILDNYKGSTGKKYADDYRAISSWVVERYYEKPSRARLDQRGRRVEGSAAPNRTLEADRPGWHRRKDNV